MAALASSAPCPRRVAVDTSLEVDTGGPEALVQLALALQQECPNATFRLGSTVPSYIPVVPRRLRAEYPSILTVPIIQRSALERGDVVIGFDVDCMDVVAFDCELLAVVLRYPSKMVPLLDDALLDAQDKFLGSARAVGREGWTRRRCKWHLLHHRRVV